MDIVVMPAVHQLGIAASTLDPGMNELAAEIEQADQFPVPNAPAQSQDPMVAAVLQPSVSLRVKAGFLRPDDLQTPQALEELALIGLRVRTLSSRLSGSSW